MKQKKATPFRETDYTLSNNGRIERLPIENQEVIAELPPDAPWGLRQKAIKEAKDRKRAFLERMRKDLAASARQSEMTPAGP